MREPLRSLFVPPVTGEQPTQGRAKLIWIVRLRWIALSAQLLAILPGLEYQILEERLLPAYLGILVLLAFVNVFTRLALVRMKDAREGLILVQLGIDIAAVSSLLTLTGGAWNPLLPILFVHTGLGALLLQGRMSLLFLALLVGSLGLIQVYSHIPPGLEPKPPKRILFPAQLVVALAFWILTSWLSGTLVALQHDFARRREQRTRIDRLRAVGALAAGLSHEFATPLNTAQLKLERIARKHALGDDDDVATAREALDRCREVLVHMAGQLRPEALNVAPVNVPRLVEQICSSAAQDCPENPLHFSVGGRGARHALLPDIAFSNAILNLIDNAVEAGGPGKDIEVRVESKPECIDISVLDSGDGWPDEVRRHLGEPFITTKPEGVGLGLYYVHTLAGAVGADLHLEDREEGGAIARLSLPTVAAVDRSEKSA